LDWRKVSLHPPNEQEIIPPFETVEVDADGKVGDADGRVGDGDGTKVEGGDESGIEEVVDCTVGAEDVREDTEDARKGTEFGILRICAKLAKSCAACDGGIVEGTVGVKVGVGVDKLYPNEISFCFEHWYICNACSTSSCGINWPQQGHCFVSFRLSFLCFL